MYVIKRTVIFKEHPPAVASASERLWSIQGYWIAYLSSLNSWCDKALQVRKCLWWCNFKKSFEKFEKLHITELCYLWASLFSSNKKIWSSHSNFPGKILTADQTHFIPEHILIPLFWFFYVACSYSLVYVGCYIARFRTQTLKS